MHALSQKVPVSIVYSLCLALNEATWTGRLTAAEAQPRWVPALAPLVLHGLPPKAHVWEPFVANNVMEGDASFGHSGASLGDASAVRAQFVELRVTTWAVARLAGPDADNAMVSKV